MCIYVFNYRIWQTRRARHHVISVSGTREYWKSCEIDLFKWMYWLFPEMYQEVTSEDVLLIPNVALDWAAPLWRWLVCQFTSTTKWDVKIEAVVGLHVHVFCFSPHNFFVPLYNLEVVIHSLLIWLLWILNSLLSLSAFDLGCLVVQNVRGSFVSAALFWRSNPRRSWKFPC